MEQKIESLSAEILELCATVEAIPSHSETWPPATNTVNNVNYGGALWTTVVSHGNLSEKTEKTAPRHQEVNHTTVSRLPLRCCRTKPWSVPVCGSRKLWGTLSSTTVRAVEKTITGLTKMSGEFTIKRKYKSQTAPLAIAQVMSTNMGPDGGLCWLGEKNQHWFIWRKMAFGCHAYQLEAHSSATICQAI